MKVTKDLATGSITAKDKKGKRAKTGKIKDLKLDGRKIVSITDDTVIVTESSPRCYWYFYRGKWYRICT